MALAMDTTIAMLKVRRMMSKFDGWNSAAKLARVRSGVTAMVKSSKVRNLATTAPATSRGRSRRTTAAAAPAAATGTGSAGGTAGWKPAQRRAAGRGLRDSARVLISHPADNGVVQRDHRFPRPACAQALTGLVLRAGVEPLIVGLADVQGLAVFQFQFIAVALPWY